MSERFLLECLLEDGVKPLFVTGAGISLASGIPTFRGSDPDAVWAHDVMQKGTNSFYLRHPHKSWAWYLARFDTTRHCEPNAAHHALVTIEQKIPSTRVITQNVDGLHGEAGTKNLIEIHGSAHKIRCTNTHCKYGAPRGFLTWDDEDHRKHLERVFNDFRAQPTRQKVPRCPLCRKYLRAHVLWFDETYAGHEDYGLKKALRWSEEGTVLIYVGTSNSVGITSMIKDSFWYEDQCIFNIDPHAAIPGTIHLAEAAETLLPRLAAAL